MPTGTFTYSYDADGNLSATDLSGSQLQGTVWEKDAPLRLAAEDLSGTGTTEADYLYVPAGSLASVTAESEEFYPVVDWMSSLTGLTSSSGAQAVSTTYSAYGQSSTSDLVAAAPSSSIGYTGSYSLTGGNGIDDMRARDYSPAAASFMTVDPLNMLTGEPYIYAEDSPVSYSYPSGLCSWYNMYCSAAQPILRSLKSDYADLCIGVSVGVGVEGCIAMTRNGTLYIGVGAVLSTPGFLASGNVAKINGNVANCQIDSFVSGWSVTAYGSAGGMGVGGTWGDVGHFGPGTTSTEAGLSTPGLSLMGSYSWRVP